MHGVGCLGVVVVQLLLALGDGDRLTDLLVGRGELLLGEVARLLRLFLHSYRLILLIVGRSRGQDGLLGSTARSLGRKILETTSLRIYTLPGGVFPSVH